jgi:hypothetical protein
VAGKYNHYAKKMRVAPNSKSIGRTGGV